MKEYYSRLFLNDGASIEEVKKAHRKLIKKFHPDKNDGTNEFAEEFKSIQEAYEKLTDYLKDDKTSNYSEGFTHQKNSNYSTGGGIVKSDAQFAEEGEGMFAEAVEDDNAFKIIMMILIGAFVFCGIYAFLSLTHLI